MYQHIKRILVLTAAVLWTGCAPTNPSFPLKPLETGETYGSIHIAVPLNKFARISLQASVYHGINEDNMLGCTLSNLVLPTSLNYSYCLSKEKNNEFVLVALNISKFNPLFEVDYAVSKISNEECHAVKFGAGIYTGIIPGRNNHLRIIPSAEYVYQNQDVRIAVGTRIGMTKTTILHLDNSREKKRYEYSISEIDTVLIDTLTAWKGYSIVLNDGQMLNVKERDPYADCLECAWEIKLQNAYTASAEHKAYYVFYSSKNPPLFHSTSGRILQLNMSRALKDLKMYKILVIEEDADVLEKTCASYNPWIADLYFDLGYTGYDQ